MENGRGIPGDISSLHPQSAFVDSNGATVTLLVDSFRYDFAHDSFERRKIYPSSRLSYETGSSALDNYSLQAFYANDLRTKYIGLYNVFDSTTMVLDSFTPGWTEISDGRMFYLNNQLAVLVSTKIWDTTLQRSRSYIRFYTIEAGRVLFKKDYFLTDIFNIEHPEADEVTTFLTVDKRNRLYFNFETRNQANFEPILAPAQAFLGRVQMSSDGLSSFKILKKYWVTKRDVQKNGEFSNWDIVMYKKQGMLSSLNDSFLYTTYLGRKKVKWAIRSGRDTAASFLWDSTLIVERYNSESFERIDSVVIKGDHLNFYSRWNMVTGPNGDIFYISNTVRDSFSILSISKPDRLEKLVEKVNVTRLKIAPFKTGDNYQLPQFNKPYKKLQFRKARTCTPELRLFADVDPYFDSFEWHIANDTGGYDMETGKNIQYFAPGRQQFYVKLKGINSRNGYYAWYSDTVSFFTAPKASFSADTNRWCQYVSLQMQNTSVSATSLEDQYTWKVYHDGQLESTYRKAEPEITFTQTGNYDIQLVYDNGYCKDSVLQKAIIEIIEAPKPGFNASDTLLCTPDTLHITDEASGRITDRYWLWQTAKTDTLRDTSFTLFIDQPGLFKLTQVLKGPTGCVTQAIATFRSTTGFTAADEPLLFTANVIDSTQATINWRVLPQGMGYQLYRDGQPGYQTSDPANDQWVDQNINTNKNSYQYQIRAIDSCRHTTGFSNPVQTLLLKAENQENQYLNLSWNAFGQWPIGVDYYELEYAQDGQSWRSVQQTPDTNTLDDLLRFEEGETIYYRITAHEQDGNRQQAISNIVKATLQPTLFVPNAFSPNGDGLNDRFAPGHFGMETIQTTIYGRNGQIVFYSAYADEAWDGTIHQKKAPVGVYVYTIKATTYKGTVIEQSGILLLVN